MADLVTALKDARRQAIAARSLRVPTEPDDWYIEVCIVCGCQLGPGVGSRTRTGRCVHEEHHSHGGTVVRVVSREEADAAYNVGYDAAQDEVWNEAVCSRCGENHDRDESAMCEGGEVVSFAAFVALLKERTS